MVTCDLFAMRVHVVRTVVTEFSEKVRRWSGLRQGGGILQSGRTSQWQQCVPTLKNPADVSTHSTDALCHWTPRLQHARRGLASQAGWPQWRNYKACHSTTSRRHYDPRRRRRRLSVCLSVVQRWRRVHRCLLTSVAAAREREIVIGRTDRRAVWHASAHRLSRAVAAVNRQFILVRNSRRMIHDQSDL